MLEYPNISICYFGNGVLSSCINALFSLCQRLGLCIGVWSSIFFFIRYFSYVNYSVDIISCLVVVLELKHMCYIWFLSSTIGFRLLKDNFSNSFDMMQK